MKNKDLSSMADYYDEWWENPKDPRGQVFAKLNKMVFDRIPDGHGKQALDLGSGCGAIIDILVKKSYNVTGIEYGDEAVKRLKQRFPSSEIIRADLNIWESEKKYDLVTMIELIQNFDQVELEVLLGKVRQITNKVLISCPNYNSLQGRWVTWMKFKAPFVHLYEIKRIEEIVEKAGFKITYRGGVGFLMPITLLSGFRIQLIPNFVVRFVNKYFDKLFPKLCALYYVELE